MVELLGQIQQSLGGATKKRTDRDTSRRAAAAWNAYFDGRKIKHTAIRNPDGPIKIDGTLYKGDRIHRVTD
jgi:hypothetical protein